MFWFIVLAITLGLMTLSDKALGNPLAFVGLGFVGFCFTLCLSVFLRMIGLSI